MAKKFILVEKKLRDGTLNRIQDQAERTAWKILADWVDIQMALVDLDQVEMIEVFLPYAYDPGKKQTLFDKWKDGSLKLLEAKKEE